MGPRVREDEVTLAAQGPFTTPSNAGTHGTVEPCKRSWGPRLREDEVF